MDRRFELWRTPRAHDPAADMALYRGLGMAERGAMIAGLCRLAAAALDARPDRDAVLRHQEPMPPRAAAWWRELVRRARSR